MSFSIPTNGGLTVLSDTGIQSSDWTRSMCVWYKPAAPSAAGTIIGWGTSGGGSFIYGSGANPNVISSRLTDGTFDDHAVTIADNDANWHLLVMVTDGDGTTVTDRHLYIWKQGTGVPADYKETVTADELSTLRGSRFRLGVALTAAAYGQSGLYAHACLWNVALSDSEVNSLATQEPQNVQNANVLEYWSLTTDSLAGGKGVVSLSTTGTAPTFDATNPSFGASAVKGRNLLLGVG